MTVRVETTNPFGAGAAQMASEASVETRTGIQRYLPLGLRTNIVLRDFIVGHAGATRYKFATVVAMVGNHALTDERHVLEKYRSLEKG